MDSAVSFPTHTITQRGGLISTVGRSLSLMRGAARLLVLSVLAVASFSAWGAQNEDALTTQSHHAHELMAAGKFKEAVPLYRSLVKALPDNPGIIMNLGLALHMAGEDEPAIAQFEKVLKLEPGHLLARMFLGASYLGLGQPEKAVPLLEKVVEAAPEDAGARGLLADALISLERYDEAAEQYRELTQLTPQDAKSWDGLGRSEEALARRALEKLQDVAPGSAYWLALVAESRVKDQQYSSAFYFYRQALEHMPGLRSAHAAVAEIYRKTGHADWAAVEEEKESALGLPDCTQEKFECDFRTERFLTLIAEVKRLDTPESFYWRARAHNRLALEAFGHLAELPPSVELHALKARIQSEHKEYREAAEQWEEALKLSPGNRRIQKELALSVSLSGDNARAEALLRGLIKDEADSPEVNYLLGNTLLSQQKPDEAIPYLEKAVGRQPQLLTAQDALARAYLQIGRSAEAIPHLKAALPADQNGSLHYQLARAYQMSGQQELARTTLAEYERITKAATEQRRSLQEEVQITPP